MSYNTYVIKKHQSQRLAKAPKVAPRATGERLAGGVGNRGDKKTPAGDATFPGGGAGGSAPNPRTANGAVS
jgi:hypothetical protein